MVLVGGVAEARPDTLGSTDTWRYQPTDKVVAYDSPGGSFKIHYTLTLGSPNAVPPDDANANGVPDFVENAGAMYDKVLAFYQQLGFMKPPSDAATQPNNGGDGKFDVYLVDFGGAGADGRYVSEKCTGDVCSGYMVQENDFAGFGYPSVDYAERVLASHEFFHAVQAGYDAQQTTVVAEGTAVWATQKFDKSLDDFEGFIPGYLDRTDHSLDIPGPGPVDPFSYGASIWFEFLDEHVGGNVIRELWEDCVDGAEGVPDPTWFPALGALLQRAHGTTFAAEFQEFAKWNLYTGARADPKRGYALGARYPLVKMTSATLPYMDPTLRVFYASTQYLAAGPGGRGMVGAAVATTQDASNLKVGVATRTGNVVSDVNFAGPVDATGADQVIVLVVNAAQSGDSIKGTLCVGTPDELAPCKPAMPDMGGGGDMAMGEMQRGGCSIANRAGARSLTLTLTLTLTILGRAWRRRGRVLA